MVVEPPVVVPRQENNTVVPVSALHQGIDKTRDVPHPRLDISRRVFTIIKVGTMPH